MENLGLGAGLVALAFWGFVAVAVVAGIWDRIRKREAQHETIRRLVESGQPIDQEVLDKLLLLSDGGRKRPDQDFKIAGLWLLPIAVGLAIFGVILGTESPDKLVPLLGVSALLAVFGIGCLVASRIVERWIPADRNSTSDQPRD